VGATATYYPDTAFFGPDMFTFAAWDGSTDSNLGVATLTVDGGPCSYLISPSAQTFSELGQVGTVQVTAGAGCAWFAASESYWLNILSSAMPGSGSGTVAYSLGRNAGSNARTGTLSIAGMTFTVIQTGAPTDANHDGLPDAWQIYYFGSASTNTATADADSDRDGMSNLKEYLAGTVPTDSGSALKITDFHAVPAERSFQLAFSSLLQRYYQVQRTADLLNPDWKGYTNAVFGTGLALPQTGPLDTPATQMFYRVLLVQ